MGWGYIDFFPLSYIYQAFLAMDIESLKGLDFLKLVTSLVSIISPQFLALE